MAIDRAQTIDSILGGALIIVQPACGYRFAIDSILLGRFARPRRRARVLELGAGCGVVSIMIAALYQPAAVIAVELQPQLASMIAQNAALNGNLAVTATCADLRHSIPGLMPGAFDYVIANPPYRSERRGRESPNPQRRAARSGDDTTLKAFVSAAARYANRGGKVAMIFTASRTVELIAELKDKSLEAKRIRFVHSRAGEAATMVLIEARKAGGIEAVIEPPLFIHGPSGSYSDEARAILNSIK
ncbi:MAG: methyltransferase [Deltaproteobacteria bacterium]|nr:methyltransferase [Deltaproteobacteria bacterium]